jgi:squalene-associated FAD-dependent desaturase
VGTDISLAIVGGGLAGMSAAARAARLGWRVSLFERAKTLGGRASSFHDPAIDAPVDFCRHAAMGCCLDFLDFCRQEGFDDCFQRTSTLHLIDPAGRQHDFTPCRWLPAPWHLLPPLARLGYLSLAERWNIVRAMRQLKRQDMQILWGGDSVAPPYNSGSAAEQEETIGQWLRRHGQTERAIEQFWSVVLAGALSETVEHAALGAARQVFRTGFVGSRGASDLVLPVHPLKHIFHDRLGGRLAAHGVELNLGATVRRIEGAGRRATALVLADGRRLEFDRFIVAVPWHSVVGLLSDGLLNALPGLETALRNIPAGAIAAVHLWFDRPAIPLPHAALVGHGGRWVFSSPAPPSVSPDGQYCQVVISAAHRLPRQSREELLREVLDQLQSIWPRVGQAKLLHHRVVVMPRAVFTWQPGVDKLRYRYWKYIENLAFAGDWTQAFWPATMESAILSGQAAVAELENDKDLGFL